jgi:hypothetical protein
LNVHFDRKRLKKQRNLHLAVSAGVELPQKSVGMYVASFNPLVLIGVSATKDGGYYL